MSHIFISYSHNDLDFARYVRALLENQGFAVWMDEKRLSAGMDWWDAIEANIDSCAAFLVIMSPESRDSVFVRNEILRAIDQKKPLFPVLVRGKHFGMLAHVHYEDMRAGLNATFSDDFQQRLVDIVGVNDERTIRVEVIEESILNVEADALLLKDAPGAGGVAQIITSLLKNTKHPFAPDDLSEVGDYKIVPSGEIMKTKHVAYVRTEWVGAFGYRQVREFANRGLAAIGAQLPDTQHLIMTIHGVNTRLSLDEGESMLAQLAGLVDVMQAWQAPRALEKISIVERNKDRVKRIKDALQEYFEEVDYAQAADDVEWGYDLTFKRATQVDTPDAGEAHIKPYVVALFPEDPELEDVFFYGVERPVHAYGLLCERVNPAVADADARTDNLQAALERIKTATAVICDVTTITPLLYLQLGYAWGRDIPTALITRNDDNPLGTDTTLQYEKIWQLEERLAQWLKGI